MKMCSKKYQKLLTRANFFAILYIVRENIAELCKGSTTDSDSVCLGSNPSSAASKKRLLSKDKRRFLNDVFRLPLGSPANREKRFVGMGCAERDVSFGHDVHFVRDVCLRQVIRNTSHHFAA